MIDDIKRLRVVLYVLMYLTAIVCANLAVTAWGPEVAIVTAFFFIGLDLTSRDALHDLWHGRSLWLKMGALILTGSLLSWVLNRNAGRVAVASFASFALSGTADAVAYTYLRRYARLLRVNGSNVVGAAADSVAFPTLAFGSFLPFIILGQFAAKVLGGFFWSLFLNDVS
jgi:uncharacterized PurR-regulated membrane protein YhhQ (DUF165 family)